MELCFEYTKRYNKTHKCHGMFLLFLKLIEDSGVPKKKFSSWALAVPEDLKQNIKEEYNLIEAINVYRAYYIRDKAYMAKWKNGNVPEWYKV